MDTWPRMVTAGTTPGESQRDGATPLWNICPTTLPVVAGSHRHVHLIDAGLHRTKPFMQQRPPWPALRDVSPGLVRLALPPEYLRAHKVPPSWRKRRRIMKALVYHGTKDVSVDSVPDAKIEKPTDVVVKITTSNICGSDLHMYEGRTNVAKGTVLGHENLGRVEEVGNAVDTVKVGDYVCLPFNIGCGFCANCERGLTGFCLTCAEPGSAGAAYGFAGMGPYSGGQAEYLRVPYADFNCLQLPSDAKEKENDYVMLSDIFPTGWHATRLAWHKARRFRGDLWRRSGRADGRHLSQHSGSEQGYNRRPASRSAETCGEDRRCCDR